MQCSVVQERSLPPGGVLTGQSDVDDETDPDDGWYIGFEPSDPFMICWHIEEQDLLGRKDILGVRRVMSGHARRAWDRFIDHAKAIAASPKTK